MDLYVSVVDWWQGYLSPADWHHLPILSVQEVEGKMHQIVEPVN